MAPIVFFFDLLSPYAYLAWTQIHRIAEGAGREVKPVPVLFAALLDHHGTKGPAEVAAKRRYLLFDTVRKSRVLGVPFGPPKHHPFNPLLGLRVASVPAEAATTKAIVDRLYAAVWSGEAANIEDAATVSRLLAEVGVDAERTIAEATSADGKARVKEQTARAIAEGAFGVPTMLVDGEPFWGVDALPDVERFLREGRATLDPETIAGWSGLRPSAVRKGA